MQRRDRTVRILFRTASISLFWVAPIACTHNSFPAPKPIELTLYDPEDETAEDRTAELTSQDVGEQNSSTIAANEKSKNKLIYYRGRAGALQALDGERTDRLEGKTLQLNFVNAPAGDAARTIIRDALDEAVSVADGVSGIITLTAPSPISAREALNALELALAESNLALIDTGAGFLLTTIEDVTQTPQAPGPRRAIGYSTTFAPVRYGVPSEIVRLVEPFLSDRLRLTADDAEGAIIVRGANVDVEEALEAIATFDAPYLTDRVFGLFKLELADVETVRNEVESLLAASGTTTQGGTSLIALPRLNLLFLSARTQETFNEARQWIERFDQPSGGDERRLRYYVVQNTPADELASQLNFAFGGAGGLPANTSSFDDNANTQEQTGQRAPQFASAPLNSDAISITPDTLNNALLIRATDQEYTEVIELIRKMDVPAVQVLIEATIAEVTLTDDLAYGVRWFFENAESSLDFSESGSLGPVFPGLNYSFIDNDVGVALNTLSSVTDVTVLSAPSIVVLNNQSANLQVGDEVPIVTQQAQAVVDGDAPIVSTLQLRETGVILEVSPRINASDVVVLDVTQEVSDVVATTTSGIDSPTIQQRRFTSTVQVRDKGTVALGGLIRETYTDSASGVPVLKDIPLLGYAFKSRDITKRRTELIVFLTPHIIRSESDAQNAFRHLRREMRNLYNDDLDEDTLQTN
ncbi:MAG: type II secretion system secretin GspD [Pseudomonadota bacterium]